MKKEIATLLCCGLLLSNLGNVRADEMMRNDVYISGISEKDSGTKKAESVNSIMNDTEHKKLLEQVMNDYYNEDGSLDCDLREYSNFKTKLSSQDKETVENYEEAADERKMASSLDYCADSILVCFEKNVSDDYIKNILENIAESVQIDNESIVIDEDLPDMEKIRIRAAQEKIDSKYVVVKLKKSYTTKRAIDCLDGIEGIRYVNLRHKLEDELVDINDEFVAQQWYLENINVSDAWEAVKSANKATTVKVAIIDSGIDINHSDLSPKILKNLSADVSGDNIVLLKNKTVPYYNSHGTNVAGAAGAVADNNIGIAGVAGITSKKNDFKCKILAVQKINYDDNIARAIRYAVSNGAKVINLSLGCYAPDEQVLVDAIEEAYAAGVTVVASAGNSGKNTNIERHYPSSEEHVISVMFTNPDNTRNYQSNYGKIYNDICAPGHNIFTTDINNNYNPEAGGSSMAAPIVSAVVAMMKGVNSKLNPDQIEDIIKSTAYDIGEPGVDDDTAYGLINAGLAVQKAKWYTIKDKQPVINSISSNVKGKISFNFKTLGNEERYNIYRSTNLDGTYVQVGNGEVDSAGKIYFKDNNVKSGIKYYYKVWVKTKYGDTYKHSLYSVPVSCVAK